MAEIVDVLERLGVQALVEHVGEERTLRLQRLGQAIDCSLLAFVLESEQGINVFRSKALRTDLMITRPKEQLSALIGSAGSFGDRLKRFNDFSWGNNDKSKRFLEFFELSAAYLIVEARKLDFLSEVAVRGPLHAYQNWIRKKIGTFLTSNQQRVIVHMPTGSGKTRTTMESICDYLRAQSQECKTVVWFAHSEELCEQAAESFSNLWSRFGCESAQVIRLWGGVKVSPVALEKPTFVVTSFQTAFKMLTTSDDERFMLFNSIRNQCGLLIVDEAHQSTAPTYQAAIELFTNRKSKIIGLTATPGRHHLGADVDATETLADFYHGHKIGIVDDYGRTLSDPIGFLTTKGILSEVTRYKLDSGTTVILTASEARHIEAMLDMPHSVLEKLGNDEKRMGKIASHAIKLALIEKRPTIIFAPSKQNAIELASLISLRGCKAGVVTGETHPLDRADAIRDFKEGTLSVLINFGVLTTGFDAPNIRAVIVARPTTSVVLYSQMIGRGLRGPLMGGTDECMIVDVNDNILNMPEANKAFTYFDKFF